MASPTRAPRADPFSLLPRGLTRLHSLWVSHTYPFARIGGKGSFHFTSKIARQRSPRISLGSSVTLGDYVWLNVATDDPAGAPTIVIEDECVVASGSILSARNQVHLEHSVNIAQQVLIMDHNHAYEDITVPIVRQGITEGGRIRIGAGSWIGHGAAIVCSRGELRIGRHCVISANSVVTRSIPDYSVVFGVPGTIIRQCDPEKGVWRMGHTISRSPTDRERVPVAMPDAPNTLQATSDPQRSLFPNERKV